MVRKRPSTCLGARLTAGIDGGVNVVFKLNGKEFCNSKAEYNAAGVGSSGHGHGGGMGDGMLSGMTGCTDPTPVKKGDIVSAEAFYDVQKHPM
jgi:hypothetical protein